MSAAVPRVLLVLLCAYVAVACRPRPRTEERVATATVTDEPTRPSADSPPPAPPPTPAEVHGGELYARICAVCHGAAGEGYKADQAPAIGRTEFLASVPNAFLRVAIMDGRSGTTMSAWSKARGGPLGPEDVDALIAFMRRWQRGPAILLDERPVAGNAAAGAEVYTRECVKCHGELGRTGPQVRIGALDWLASASNGLVRHAIRAGRPATEMPRFDEKLGDRGVEDVIAYLRSLQAQAPVPAPPQVARPAPLPLGKVPLNPRGAEPKGFRQHPETTPADVVHAQLQRKAKMVLLDARAPPDYVGEHIAGAVSVPFYDPSPYLKTLPKDAWLVCYCACPHAESRDLASKLVAAGFEKVTVLDEGLGFWKSKGYATKTGHEQ